MNNGEALTLTMCNKCIVLFVFFKLALPTRLKRGKRKKTMKLHCCSYKEMTTIEDGSRKKSEKNKQGKGTKSQDNHCHKNITFLLLSS
jgi:hypothetical protein